MGPPRGEKKAKDQRKNGSSNSKENLKGGGIAILNARAGARRIGVAEGVLQKSDLGGKGGGNSQPHSNSAGSSYSGFRWRKVKMFRNRGGRVFSE